MKEAERATNNLRRDQLKRMITSTIDLEPNGKIQIGMIWLKNDSEFKVTNVIPDESRCVVKETWKSKDSWKSCFDISEFRIEADADGVEYAQSTEFMPDRFCALDAVNYPT